MATWEDGPEYAPIERPAEFAVPAAASPLSQAAPYEQMAALAPKGRPQFAGPTDAVRPLADLHPAVEASRDPQIPFEVAGSTMTTESSAWGALHWSPPSGAPSAGPSGPWRPPTGPGPGHVPVAPPTQPIRLSDAPPATGPTGLPAPGTPGWFAPPAYGQPLDRRPFGARQVFEAATPGLVITLLIGGLVYLIAPITFFIGLGLSRRIRVVPATIRKAWNVGLAAFLVIAVLGSLGSTDSFSDWWGAIGITALLASWVMLVITLVLVRNGLAAGHSGSAPPPRPWG